MSAALQTTSGIDGTLRRQSVISGLSQKRDRIMRSSPIRRSRLPEAVVSLGEVELHPRAEGAALEQTQDGASRIHAVGEVLREWRAAERALGELAPGTREWTRALGEVELHRSRYQQVSRAEIA
jgi:hypothetical protein